MAERRVLSLVLIGVLSSMACAGILNSTRQSLDESSLAVASSFSMDEDLRPIIHALSETDFSNVDDAPSSIRAGLPGAPFSVEMDKLNPDAYTERELKLMTGRAHAGGGRTTVDHLLILCHGFKSQHGVFPSNSSELLAFLWQNDVQTGRRVHSMSLKDQFMEVGLLVNPVTGKFYESFASTEWVRGGVNFRELHLPSEIDAAFVNAFGWPSGQGLQVASDPNVIGVWSIELWGEKPGIKLGSRPVTTMMPSKDRVLVEKQQSEGQTHPH